jgi:hypothetical protein
MKMLNLIKSTCKKIESLNNATLYVDFGHAFAFHNLAGNLDDVEGQLDTTKGNLFFEDDSCEIYLCMSHESCAFIVIEK